VVSADGTTVALPALLRHYPTAQENERLYLIMAAHEAGHRVWHLPAGSSNWLIWCRPSAVVTIDPCLRRSNALGDLFRLYPQPRLVKDLWAVLGRVSTCFRRNILGSVTSRVRC
jgi:hypothetical protein